MKSYSAQNGLDVMKYLGVTNLTDDEIRVFNDKWKEVYGGRGNDFVGTIWTLYAEVLPFTCGDGDRGSFVVSQLRDSDFGDRIEKSGLEDDLKK